MRNLTKFNIEKLGHCNGGERIGTWELPNNHLVQSPGLWLTTSACGVPHLTPETLQMTHLLDNNFAGLLVSYEKHARSIDVYQDYKKGFRSFAGLPSTLPVMLTIMDPMLKSKSGYNTAQSISVWGECKQRESVTVQQYQTGVNALKPDIFVSLCDSDFEGGSNKRAQKATKFTQNSVDVLINQENFLHVGPIGGSYNEQLRVKTAQWMATKPLDGYLLDAFHTNGETSLEVDLNQLLPIVQNSILPSLPRERPRFYFGMLTPHTILKLVEIGVDFFETSYVYYKTDQGKALTFRNRLNDDDDDRNDSDSIDLNLVQYKNDFDPILKNCSCYCCRKHTRGYIHHLLDTKELLAGVLLTIHNLHHYATFFQTIREAIAQETFEELLKHFELK